MNQEANNANMEATEGQVAGVYTTYQPKPASVVYIIGAFELLWKELDFTAKNEYNSLYKHL